MLLRGFDAGSSLGSANAWQELGTNVQKRLLDQASPAERLKLLRQFDRDKLEPTKDEQLAILAKESQM